MVNNIWLRVVRCRFVVSSLHYKCLLVMHFMLLLAPSSFCGRRHRSTTPFYSFSPNFLCFFVNFCINITVSVSLSSYRNHSIFYTKHVLNITMKSKKDLRKNKATVKETSTSPIIIMGGGLNRKEVPSGAPEN